MGVSKAAVLVALSICLGAATAQWTALHCSADINGDGTTNVVDVSRT